MIIGYLNNGGYGEPLYDCRCTCDSREMRCPRKFWSQYSKYLEKLWNIFRNAANELCKENPKNLYSEAYGKLALYRLFVSIRLDKSLSKDAEAAGLASYEDRLEYYRKKNE